MIQRIVALMGVMLFSSAAQAGLYTDDLARCLVESTSKEDRISLVRWMFVSAAAHPAVSSIASVTDKTREEANRQLASMFVRLLTESCQEKAKKAFQTDGPLAVQRSFAVLGQVAASELFASPEVAKSMSSLEKYVDPKALDSLAK